jgi:hypothetical protein
MKKLHKALATVEEFKAIRNLPISDQIAWWNELVRLNNLK